MEPDEQSSAHSSSIASQHSSLDEYNSRYSNGGGGGGPSGRGNNRRRLAAIDDDDPGMTRPLPALRASAVAPHAEPSPFLLESPAPLQLQLPQQQHEQQQHEQLFAAPAAVVTSLPTSLADRVAGDAEEMNSLLHADSLDRPQHEWSSFSSSECVNNNNGDPFSEHQNNHNDDQSDASEHALHDFGTAARATLATLPAGLIRRLVAKLFQVRDCASLKCC